MKDRSNPRAHTAILVPYQFFFHAFRTVYEHLPQAEFIPDFSASPPGLTYPEHYKESFRSLLSEQGVFWRDLETSNLSHGEFFDKYHTLITPIPEGVIRHPCNKNRRKVRIFYGTAKDSWAYGLHNARFDLILCPGNHAKQNLSLYETYNTKVVSVGEPKLDDLVNEKDKAEILKKSGLTLDPSKETVLFLPTWGSLSSLPKVAPLLPSLLPEYNVIVKIHHMTKLYAPQELEFVRHPSIQIADERLYITDAFRLADIVMSDNSSSIFDAVAADKPLMLIDTLGYKDTEFFIEVSFFSVYDGKVGGTSTHRDSLEQVVKRAGREMAPVARFADLKISSPEFLKAIQSAKNNVYKERQLEIKRLLFSSLDGKAGERAAHAIQTLIAHPQERNGTLERLLDEYEHQIRTSMSNLDLENTALAKKLRAIRKMPYMERIRTVAKEFFE